MMSTGHAWSYKAWCSAVISYFSTALIGAFRSLLFHSVICSLGSPLSHDSPVVVFWLWASTLLQFLLHHPCWFYYGEVLNELPLWGSRSINEVKFNDLIAWRRLAVCCRNVAIYITRDYIVRQTKKLIFYHDWMYYQKLNWIQRFLYWNESRFICHIAFC